MTLTLDEPLASLPGLFFQNQFNSAQDLRISLRGFGARSAFGVRGIKVLVDGIPRTMPDGQTQLDSIDPAVIESIEVLRGPSSSLYGNASGGVISIITEDGAENGIDFAPRITVGDYGLQKYQVKAGGVSGSVNYRVYASHLKFDGYRDHSASEHTLAQAKFLIQTGPGSDWTFTVEHFHSPLAEDPGALTSAETDADPSQASANNISFSAGEQVKEQNLSARYRTALSDNHELTLTAHLNRRDFANKLAFTSGGIVEFERLAPGLGVHSVWDDKLLDRPNRLITGVDVHYQHDDRKRFDNDQGRNGAMTLDQVESVFNLAPYLRNEFDLSPRVGLAAGLRYDYVYYDLDDAFLDDGAQSDNRTLSEWSGTLGAVFHVKETLHLYANAATVFEVPTTTELTNQPSGDPGFNPDLEAQTSVSYEIGAKGEGPDRMDYDLAFFFIRSTNELISFELENSPGRNFSRNAGESERIGLEARIRYSLFPDIDLSLSYSYSDFEFTEFVSDGVDVAGNDLPGIPKHLLAGKVDAQWGGGWFSRLEFQYVDEFSVDNENANSNPSYTTSRFVIGKEKKTGSVLWSAFLGLNNLLDETYNANTRINASGGRFFEPAPPFNVFGAVSITFGPSD